MLMLTIIGLASDYGMIKIIINLLRVYMKKISTTVVVFIAAALMVTGCEKKKDDDKGLLLGMAYLAANALPPTQYSGSEQNVASASSALFATSAAMSQVRIEANPGTGMMQSVFGDVDPSAKDGLKKSILDAVNANAIEKMKYVNTSCSGTNQIKFDLTPADAIIGTNYTITPEVHVSGSFTCNSAATSGSYNVAITIIGKVTATFNNTVQVFDIVNYQNTTPHKINFKEVSVNGTVTISDVNVTTNVSFNYSALPLPSLALVVNNLSGVAIASDLQIDGGTAVALNLNVAEKFNFNLSLLGISGSASAIVDGTVNSEEVYMSYGFSGDNIFQFNLPAQIGYAR